MKLKDYLAIVDWFDGELITKSGLESQFSFVWCKDTTITKEGQTKFKTILNSGIRINKSVIILEDETITDEEFDLFHSAVAGYISTLTYDKWFKTKD